MSFQTAQVTLLAFDMTEDQHRVAITTYQWKATICGAVQVHGLMLRDLCSLSIGTPKVGLLLLLLPGLLMHFVVWPLLVKASSWRRCNESTQRTRLDVLV